MKPVYQAECYNPAISSECCNPEINAEALEMVDEERKRKWIKEMRDKCGKFLVMHTCYKCGKVDGLGVSSAVDMSFLCLDCLANMLFEKKPSLDVKDFTKT